MTTHKESREVRREQIVEAAMKVIATRGTRGATTKAIAREVGISEGALYRHFQTRDEILSLVVGHIGAGLQENLRGLRGDASAPLEKLEALFLRHVRFVEAHRGIPRLAFSEEVHLHRPDLRLQMATNVEGYLERVRELMEDGKRAGSIRTDADSQLLAMMLVGTLQALTLRWSLSGFSFPLAERARAAWQGFRRLVSVNDNGRDTSPGNTTL